MRKILLIILLAACAFINANSQSITKTGPASVHVGEVFEYTITISGFTNLSQLGSIVDVLPPGLTYISSDFTTSSGVFSFYSFWCPTATLTETSSGLTHTFNFPSSSICNGSGSSASSLSFKIKVSTNSDACALTSISNTVKLFNQSGSNIPVAVSLPSSVIIDHSNPWSLNKTFRSFTGGYLIYDVRLSSSVGEYNMNVFNSADFTDDFTTDPCIGADVTQSEVGYIADEANLNGVIQISPAILVGTNIFRFQWSLPPGTPTRSSYLFQIKIKTTGCYCPGTAFNLLNHVNLTGTDNCGAPIILDDDFNLLNAKCINNNFTPLDEAKLCVKKEVFLDNNALNLTMKGCKGHYTITLNNCTNTFNYTAINLTDVFPANNLLTIDPNQITVAPNTYSITSTSSGLTLNTTAGLAPGGVITITIPFEVASTVLPNTFIKNCADVTAVLNDGVAPSTTVSEHFCDMGIRTVPDYVAVVTNKQICTSPVHTCGGQTINTNLPGDIVEYALHVFNFGTDHATNFIVTDNIPAFFNILNPANDIRIYKKEHLGSVITDACDVSAFTDITPFVSKTLTGNNLTVDFLANNLDEFTCDGVTHYIIKIKTQIAANVPNGSYPNVFQTQYTEHSTGLVKQEVSNTVTSIVNRDNLVFTKKTATKVSQDCVNKTATVEYEIWAINMGYQPIAINVSDVISVPSPLSILSGINLNTIKSQIINSSGTSPWNLLTSVGVMTVASTANTLNIDNYEIAPCTLVKFKYSVVFNTNNLSVGQSLNVCNNAVITVGYLLSDKKLVVNSLPDITVSKDPRLINKYFAGETDFDKYKALEKIKSANKAGHRKMERVKKPIEGTEIVFVPIDTIGLVACINISDCLHGSGTGCFTAIGSGNFTFTVNSIDNSGQAATTLTVPATAPKVRKVEYILADIRMLADPCVVTDPNCYNCNPSVVGNFSNTSASIGGGLVNQNIPLPGIGNYKEKNKVEFSNPLYQNITGTWGKTFQLPTGSLNCNGNLEVVITAIVYFEDCSVCYVSNAYDYNATFSWDVPVTKQVKSKGTKINPGDSAPPKKN